MNLVIGILHSFLLLKAHACKAFGCWCLDILADFTILANKISSKNAAKDFVPILCGALVSGKFICVMLASTSQKARLLYTTVEVKSTFWTIPFSDQTRFNIFTCSKISLWTFSFPLIKQSFSGSQSAVGPHLRGHLVEVATLKASWSWRGVALRFEAIGGSGKCCRCPPTQVFGRLFDFCWIATSRMDCVFV